MRTFTIGFDEAGYDEAPYAAAVAQHLGTDHTELYVTPEDALDVIPRLPAMYDEPFADSSQIPTYLVSRAGAASTSRSPVRRRRRRAVRRLPRATSWDRNCAAAHCAAAAAAGPALARMLGGACRPRVWNACSRRRAGFVPRALRREPRRRQAAQAGAAARRAHDPEAIYHRARLALAGRSCSDARELPIAVTRSRRAGRALDDPLERMMYLDQISYLPDDILVKVDRASMACQPRSARAAARSSRSSSSRGGFRCRCKLRDGSGKWLLRQRARSLRAAGAHRSAEDGLRLSARSTGCAGRCATGRSRCSSERRSAPAKASSTPHAVREKWAQHVAGRGEWQQYLWTVLMFQAWSEARRRDMSSVRCRSPSRLRLAQSDDEELTVGCGHQHRLVIAGEATEALYGIRHPIELLDMELVVPLSIAAPAANRRRMSQRLSFIPTGKAITCGSPFETASSVDAHVQSVHVFTDQRWAMGTHGQSPRAGAAIRMSAKTVAARVRMRWSPAAAPMKPPCQRVGSAQTKAAPRSAGRLRGNRLRRSLQVGTGAVEGARAAILLDAIRCERANLAAGVDETPVPLPLIVQLFTTTSVLPPFARMPVPLLSATLKSISSSNSSCSCRGFRRRCCRWRTSCGRWSSISRHPGYR